MNIKKLIWILLGGAFLWIVADFSMDMYQQKKAQSSLSSAKPSPTISSKDTHELTEEEKAFLESFEESDMETVDTPAFAESENEEFDVATKMTVGSNPGQTAFDFELSDMEGNLVKLSDYRGKKVFLNFWASWCPPCRAEMPHLQEFSTEQEEVIVLGVNVTSSESNLDHVTAFLDEMGATFKNVYGEPIQFDQYRTQSLPTSFFIGSDGVIYDKVIGPVTKDALQARFDMID